MEKFKYIIEEEEGQILITTKDDDEEEVFHISIEQNNFCCGIVELGSFELEAYTDYDYADLVDNESFCRQLDLALKAFCRALKSEKKGSRQKQRGMTTLINSAECNLVRDSLMRIGLFKQIDSFINKNSGNKVEIWLTK